MEAIRGIGFSFFIGGVHNYRFHCMCMLHDYKNPNTMWLGNMAVALLVMDLQAG
jgi:hypothetical protein